MTPRHYIPAMDGLRAVAVFLVMLHHLSYSRFPGGRIGVDIFFVLSGLLITAILLRERDRFGSVSLRAFYARRVLRLMPALVLVVAAEAAIYTVMGSQSPHEITDILSALLYLKDFQLAFSGSHWVDDLSHTWSLSVEEHFYIVWPLLLLLIVKLPAKWQAPVVMAIFAVVVAWRTDLVFRRASVDRIEFAFDTRCDELLLGCALALWLHNKPSARAVAALASLWPIGIATVIAITFVDVNANPWMQSIGWSAAGLMESTVVLALTRQDNGILGRVLATRPMVAVGRVSYGIYLWHWPLLLHARAMHEKSQLLAASACLLGVGLAFLSYRYVEEPFLRLKPWVDRTFGHPFAGRDGERANKPRESGGRLLVAGE